MEHHQTRPPSSGTAQFLCGSYRPEGRGSAATEKGLGQHEWLEDKLNNKPVRKEVPEDEQANVKWAYEYVLDNFDIPKLQVESKVTILDDEYNELSFGTRDLWDGRNLGDFKSGQQHDYRAQMAYYVLGTCQREGVTSVKVHEIYTKFFWAKVYEMTKEEAQQVVDAITENIEKDVPKPNEYCSWCVKRIECPAFTTALVEVANDIEPSSGFALENLDTPESVNRAMVFAKRIRKWCDGVEGIAKDMLKDGEKLNNFEYKSRKGANYIADIPKAFEILGLTQDEFLKACNVSNTSLVALYAKKNDMKPADAKRELARKLLEVTKTKPDIKILKECQA
tara:strand:- start:3510 stop:4520 length:1011 start_codon:yes stop_codon:yes gene_type:complete